VCYGCVPPVGRQCEAEKLTYLLTTGARSATGFASQNKFLFFLFISTTASSSLLPLIRNIFLD
jgi:hypothetical protein